MCLAIPGGMNALYAAPLGIAAALAGTLAGATAQAAEPTPEPVTRPLQEPVPDLLAPKLAEAAARLEAYDPAPGCDDKCKAVVLTEATFPGTGAADILSVVIQPEQHALSIPKSDGTPALTFMAMPTRVTRGEGLVATAKF